MPPRTLLLSALLRLSEPPCIFGSRPAGRRKAISRTRTSAANPKPIAGSRAGMSWRNMSSQERPRRMTAARNSNGSSTPPPSSRRPSTSPPSRFFRDQFQLEFHVRKLAKNNVRLVSITQELGDGNGGVRSAQLFRSGDPYGIRTRVTAVKGRCPRPLDEGVGAAQRPNRSGRGNQALSAPQSGATSSMNSCTRTLPFQRSSRSVPTTCSSASRRSSA
jgi:hypothetical protein